MPHTATIESGNWEWLEEDARKTGLSIDALINTALQFAAPKRKPMGAAEALNYGLDRIEGVSHEKALARARGENSDERLEAHVPERRPQCREM